MEFSDIQIGVISSVFSPDSNLVATTNGNKVIVNIKNKIVVKIKKKFVKVKSTSSMNNILVFSV